MITYVHKCIKRSVAILFILHAPSSVDVLHLHWRVQRLERTCSDRGGPVEDSGVGGQQCAGCRVQLMHFVCPKFRIHFIFHSTSPPHFYSRTPTSSSISIKEALKPLSSAACSLHLPCQAIRRSRLKPKALHKSRLGSGMDSDIPTQRGRDSHG